MEDDGLPCGGGKGGKRSKHRKGGNAADKGIGKGTGKGASECVGSGADKGSGKRCEGTSYCTGKGASECVHSRAGKSGKDASEGVCSRAGKSAGKYCKARVGAVPTGIKGQQRFHKCWVPTSRGLQPIGVERRSSSKSTMMKPAPHMDVNCKAVARQKYSKKMAWSKRWRQLAGFGREAVKEEELEVVCEWRLGEDEDTDGFKWRLDEEKEEGQKVRSKQLEQFRMAHSGTTGADVKINPRGRQGRRDAMMQEVDEIRDGKKKGMTSSTMCNQAKGRSVG